MFGLDACFEEEERGAADEVGQRFVGDGALLDGIPERLFDLLSYLIVQSANDFVVAIMIA